MDDYQQVNADEYQRLMAILKTNSDKTFVQRILRPGDFPTLDQGDGSYATHKMAWGESGGKYVVYPTVLMEQGGGLKDYGPKDAWNHVQQTGNFIEFNNPQDAEWFSTRYKGAWGGKMNNEPK